MGSSNSTFSYDDQLLSDTDLQSQETKTGPACRRFAGFPENCLLPFEESKEATIVTIWDAFQRGVRINPKGNMLGTRHFEKSTDSESPGYKIDKQTKFVVRGKYVWDSYEEVAEKSLSVGFGLCHLGIKQNANVGIFAQNRAEWIVSALALWSQSMRVVSLYATLGENAVEYIVTQSELELIFIEKKSLKAIAALLAENKIPTVKYIVQFDANEKYGNFLEVVDADDIKTVADYNVKLLGLSEVEKLGQEHKSDPVLPKSDDLCYIMYTSGTTGNPKGVMLSHGNVISALSAIPHYFPIEKHDVHISYLPLAHIFETVMQGGFFLYGASVGFYQGNVKMLTHDFITLRPTVLAGVPRVFAKIYQKVFAGVEQKNCMVKWYFNKAYKYQCEAVRDPKNKTRDPTYDTKLFIPLRTKVGLDRCRLVISGAAPLPPHIAEFLKVVVGADVIQGYGMTETAAVLTLCKLKDPNVGHVGPPNPACEVRLVAVPEMNYLLSDKHPRGEVQVRGPCVFKGYFKNEEATAKTMVEGGWMATGDIGRWNPNGTLSIIDRKKNIFKLANGEYIASEKIENVYSKSPFVGQIWVYGNSFKNFIVAVVVPNAEQILSLCEEKKWWPSENPRVGNPQFLTDFKTVIEGEHKDQIKTIIFNSLKAFNSDLKRFEQLKDIVIESEIDSNLTAFTEENSCMTPTFKLRRLQLLQRYVVQLKQLYADNGEPPKDSEKWPGEKEN